MEEAGAVVLFFVAFVRLLLVHSQLLEVLDLALQCRVARVNLEELLDGLFGLHQVAQQNAALGRSQVSLLELRVQRDRFSGVVQRFFVIGEHHLAGAAVAQIAGVLGAKVDCVGIVFKRCMVILSLILRISCVFSLFSNSAEKKFN